MRFDRQDAKTQRGFFLGVFTSLRSFTLAALLICSAGESLAEWSTYHGDSGLQGVSNVDVSSTAKRLWRFNASGAVYNTPVSDGERVFFSAQKGHLFAVDLKGSTVWKKIFMRTNDAGANVPIRFEAPLAVFGNTVFAGTTRGTLIALDAKTSEELWRYETDGFILGSPNFILREKGAAVVVLDQSEGALHAVDVSTGKRLWKTEGVERCDGAPGIGGGRIVFGSCLAALHVYSIDGVHLKDIEIGGDSQVAGGVAVDGKFAFAGVRDGSLLCADLEQGDIVWFSHESEEQTFSTPAVTSNRVVYSSDNGWVYAVDYEDGSLIWKHETGGLPTSPVIAKDKVVVSADGVLYLLDRKDGHRVWSTEVSDEISSPALVGKQIVVGADDGAVSAFGEVR